MVEIRSFNAHAQQKDFSSDELETLRRSRKENPVVTDNGEVPSHEETQVSMFKLASSRLCNDSEIRLQFYRLVNFPKNTGVPM